MAENATIINHVPAALPVEAPRSDIYALIFSRVYRDR